MRVLLLAFLLLAASANAQTVRRQVTVITADDKKYEGRFVRADESGVTVESGDVQTTVKLETVRLIMFGGAPPANQSGGAVLNIEAGIIYKMGGNQPVARAEFHLLDASAEAIMQGAGLVPESRLTLLNTYALAMKYQAPGGTFLQRAQEALKPHVVQSVTTDFGGKAQFRDVPPGSYFVLGVTSTRRGLAVWNVPVEVKAGDNSLMLDQNNAASAF